MRDPIVAGNWKMNGDTASIDHLLGELLAELDQSPVQHCKVLVFPSYIYLRQVAEKLSGSVVGVGAQDIDQREAGAVTGAVSAEMLKDVGCDYVLVGHSERRTLFGEDDQTVARKYVRALAGQLTPVVCVGETLEERQAGATLQVVTRQLQAVINLAGAEGIAAGLVAYEPVWAIGTGESATPEQAEEVHAGLRQCLAELDAGIANEMRILYGGSVTPENAQSLFANDNVDGALVGGASLKAKSFADICRAADER